MKHIIFLLLLVPSLALAAGGGHNPHQVEANINLQDNVSLQNGARLFMNYCMGCHSMKYLRYERIAEDLDVPAELVEANLMFNASKLGQPAVSSIDTAAAKSWFGNIPPDLTMITRVRSADWVYSYLTTFYTDETRPFGYNNHMLENVGMPHVMAELQASLSDEEFKSEMRDLTGFMTYASEPTRLVRENLGVKVLVFLFILLIVVVWLNAEFWKDID